MQHSTQQRDLSTHLNTNIKVCNCHATNCSIHYSKIQLIMHWTHIVISTALFNSSQTVRKLAFPFNIRRADVKIQQN